jgi:hypothetical protein
LLRYEFEALLNSSPTSRLVSFGEVLPAVALKKLHSYQIIPPEDRVEAVREQSPFGSILDGRAGFVTLRSVSKDY